MARVPQCDYTIPPGLDNRYFRQGERVCVRQEDGDVLGTFRGLAPNHIYAPGDAMDPDTDNDINGYRITGIDPNPNEEHLVRFEDVGRLLNKRGTSETGVKKVFEDKGISEDIERRVRAYGGKKSRRARKSHRKHKNGKTRRRH